MALNYQTRNLLLLGLAAIFMGCMGSGCTPYVTTFVAEFPGSLQCQEDSRTAIMVIKEDDLCVCSFQGCWYVFGSPESAHGFIEDPGMKDGLLEKGAGPGGEDVFFETDALHPEFVKELQNRYHDTPKLLRRVGRDYSVWKLKGRIFILGPNPKVERDFVRSKELVLAKTFFGTGPCGETVVVEASKSNNQFADLLMERFNSRPVLIETRCPDYFVWRVMGRVIVVGSVESSLDLETGRELASTRALTSVGPNGETVVFETDSRRPELLQRLATTYFGEDNIPRGLTQ